MDNLHKKTKANAVSAYLLIWINWAFLLNKQNEYIDNNFVKSHTKTALFIHFWLLLNLIVFVWNNPLTVFSILGYSLWDIIAMLIFLGLTTMIFIGAYKAQNWEYWYTKDLIKLSGDKKLLDINGDLKINERDKLTLILAHIPFIGAYLYGKYSKYAVVQTIWKLNLYITSLIVLLYITGNQNLANIVSLGYIIYIVFGAINLFTNQKLLQINLDFLPTPNDLKIHSYTLIKYLKNYIWKQKFVNYSELKSSIILQEQKNKKLLETQLQALPKNKNIKKYSVYIKSGIILMIATIIILLTHIVNAWLLVIFLIALYTAGYIQYSLSYKTPFIYDLYEITKNIFLKIKSFFIKTKKLHQKEEIKTMKVTAK